MEAEKEKMPEFKVTSLKAKSAVALEEEGGIQDLRQKIDALTTVVKSSNFNAARPKQPNGNGNGAPRNKTGDKQHQSPYKGQGPGTSSASPFKQGKKPFQCYNCGGWGRYSERVPIILGTLHIKDIIETATKEELRNLGEAWEMGTLGSFVLARMAELSKTPMIQQIDHYIRLTRKVTLPPMQVHKTVGSAKIPVLAKRLNMATEPLPHQETIDGVEAIESYETFKQGANRVTIGLQNNTRQSITLKKGTRVARVMAANVVPPHVGHGSEYT